MMHMTDKLLQWLWSDEWPMKPKSLVSLQVKVTMWISAQSCNLIWSLFYLSLVFCCWCFVFYLAHDKSLKRSYVGTFCWEGKANEVDHKLSEVWISIKEQLLAWNWRGDTSKEKFIYFLLLPFDVCGCTYHTIISWK